ncbi:MAG TPA: NAD(P)/FAD-dependent oxidoreductase, partial [Pseudomonadaceae bacterium]|nr:NAD(P)/FAD-dependent oxidoreductase [Pseudomonadaceae bacterium]
AGLEMIEEDQTTLCFLVSKHHYHACKRHWPKLLQQLCTTSSQLQQRLAGAQTLWPQPLAIYRVPFGYLHTPAAPEPGLFRLGDQAAVIASLAGDGIAIALHSAQLAARIYAAGGDPSDYRLQALQSFRSPVRTAQLLTWLFSGARGRRLSFALSRLWPALVDSAIVHTRLKNA